MNWSSVLANLLHVLIDSVVVCAQACPHGCCPQHCNMLGASSGVLLFCVSDLGSLAILLSRHLVFLSLDLWEDCAVLCAPGRYILRLLVDRVVGLHAVVACRITRNFTCGKVFWCAIVILRPHCITLTAPGGYWTVSLTLPLGWATVFIDLLAILLGVPIAIVIAYRID